ncbi:TetR family transcriptional regulator [Corynebacterium canis]|uniref:TetR family transcriptional regulator n=3 Tax=Corynebacterium canis TaxID=679663 RepID=A0A5C5UEX5_9CORY|nr:TetR family transcriptional regulator [Corynebacterium canis]WJY74415.1 putative HTH-type transcriptional regulator [Corynebacterium canis]
MFSIWVCDNGGMMSEKLERRGGVRREAAGREGGVRAKNREATERAILRAAERHLAERGAAALSLRQVARDVGMVPSAIYRYFNGIDELYTALIVRAFEDQSAYVRAAVEGLKTPTTWEERAENIMVLARAVRGWAKANPHFYSLVYGSPVPGYQAPEATIAPAAEVGQIALGWLERPVAATSGEIPEPVAAFWAAMYGMISFELFGHFVGVLEDVDGFYERGVRNALAALRRELDALK